ncbi:Amyloid protein-binding protein 2 [Xenoophorus captivus]|uniref:Amyloid protein-binding protein 2 n=1 Tax=Xenoophorus captivus TaxID=1517983 RepID=A0ABV0S7F3_9TELE
MDHGVKVASVLANSFSRRCSYIAESDAHVAFCLMLAGTEMQKRCFCRAYSCARSTVRFSTVTELLLHVRNGNCKYHLGEETFKLAQSYMDKLAKHGHQANKAALYGELCALLFAKSHYDEVRMFKTLVAPSLVALTIL